jgi:hypothetical protein
MCCNGKPLLKDGVEMSEVDVSALFDYFTAGERRVFIQDDHKESSKFFQKCFNFGEDQIEEGQPKKFLRINHRRLLMKKYELEMDYDTEEKKLIRSLIDEMIGTRAAMVVNK